MFWIKSMLRSSPCTFFSSLVSKFCCFLFPLISALLGNLYHLPFYLFLVSIDNVCYHLLSPFSLLRCNLCFLPILFALSCIKSQCITSHIYFRFICSQFKIRIRLTYIDMEANVYLFQKIQEKAEQSCNLNNQNKIKSIISKMLV